MAKILAIDLGTTYFKLTLFDRSGRLCCSSRIAPPVVVRETGLMELSVDGFLDALGQGIAELRQDNGGSLSDVEAVSFATQTNSFVLLDAQNGPMTPIVLWPDGRAAALETELQQRCAIAEFTATTGIPQMGYQFMLTKLLWWQRHAPDVWTRTRKICLISDYLTFLLTGQFVSEAGAAGLTGLVDIRRCQWWPEMLARFGITGDRLPTVVRAGTDLGGITSQAAQRFGLPNACRFVVGCLDQYAGAIGAGNVEPGIMSETTGTVLATVRCADGIAPPLGPSVFQGPAFHESRCWRMAFGDVSANYLQWYRDQLPDRPTFDELTELAAAVAPGADGLKLRTDVALTTIEAVFSGMTPQHTRGHAVRCILEAVADALNSQAAALSHGSPTREIRCAGGGARSDLWLQIKADMLGVPTRATVCPEPTSLGAAMLAEAALGRADVRQIASRWVRLKPPHPSDPQEHRSYELRRRGAE